MDDILVHSPSWDVHIKSVLEVLSRMAQAKLTARLSKTIIGTNVVDFVGYELGHGVSSPL